MFFFSINKFNFLRDSSASVCRPRLHRLYLGLTDCSTDDVLLPHTGWA